MKFENVLPTENQNIHEYKVKKRSGISKVNIKQNRNATMFNGKEFDKHTLGSTFVAKSRVKELLTKKYPLTDNFKETNEFKEIIQMLN